MASIDRAGKRVSVEAIGRKCDYEKLAWVPETLRDTSSWAVRNGKLYLWEKGMCKGETYAGGATAIDPIGSWTLDEGAAWPSDLASAGCTEPAAELPSDAWRKRTLAVTDKEWMERTEFEACTGDLFMALVRFQMGGDSASTLIKNTCKEGAVKDKAGDIASLQLRPEGRFHGGDGQVQGQDLRRHQVLRPGTGMPRHFHATLHGLPGRDGFRGTGARRGAVGPARGRGPRAGPRAGPQKPKLRASRKPGGN